jgi:hypothetical protein
MLSPIELFMLGWREYQKKQQMVRLLSPFGEFDHAVMQPPSPDEIVDLIRAQESETPTPPYRLEDMKEHPIG